MKIFRPLPNFYGYPDFGLEGSTCSSIMKTLKSTQFCKGSRSFKQQLILMKMKCIRCKYNLIHFTCSYDRWLYYYRLKSETKWFWMKNYDGLFSTLIHMSYYYITGGSVIWPMSINPTLLHKGTKTMVILWSKWLPLAHLKVIKLQTSQGHALSNSSSAIHTT